MIVVSTQDPYQTLVSSATAGAVVCAMVVGLANTGTPAYKSVGMPTFEAGLVGPTPKPLRLIVYAGLEKAKLFIG